MINFEESNKALWDELTDVHIKSYGVDKFLNGQSTLDEIQLRDLGNVRGKTMLHLQCHFGLDTLSWAREGAVVTGVDFVEKAIDYANKLKEKAGLNARFICSNIYDLEKSLNEQFDIVYTSQGVLCWLKDLKEWARLIHRFLKPGGTFYIMETHPIANIFDYRQKGMNIGTQPYFHNTEPIICEDNDYSDPTHVNKNPSYEWNWSLSDIFNALIDAGLTIESFHEYGKCFFKAFPDMVKIDDYWWVLPGYEDKMPMTFTIRAGKKWRIESIDYVRPDIFLQRNVRFGRCSNSSKGNELRV